MSLTGTKTHPQHNRRILMNRSRLKSVIGGLFFVLVFSLLGVVLQGCSSTVVTAADGLSLHALVGVVRQSQHGEDLERRLNTAGGINNLDLDHDGQVDFINVTEFGTGEFRGYSLLAHLGDNSTQEVATVNIHSGLNEFTIQVKGNEQIYGGQAYVTSRIGRHQMAAVPFIAWAFLPARPIYVVPIVVGHRPGWYAPPRVVPVTQYRTVTKTIVKTVVVEKKAAPIVAPSTVVNPNAGKTTETVKAVLVKPTETQKAFQARPENQPVAKGGFGKDKQTTPRTQIDTVPVERTTPSVKPDLRQEKKVVPQQHINEGKTVKQFEQRDEKKAVEVKGFGNNKTSTSTSTVPMRKQETPAQRNTR